MVPPSKKLDDLIHLAELCVDLLQQNEEHYAEVSVFPSFCIYYIHIITYIYNPVNNLLVYIYIYIFPYYFFFLFDVVYRILEIKLFCMINVSSLLCKRKEFCDPVYPGYHLGQVILLYIEQMLRHCRAADCRLFFTFTQKNIACSRYG